MRRRSIWRESSGASVCTFCAYRLGAARAPSQVPRRFLYPTTTRLYSATAQPRQSQQKNSSNPPQPAKAGAGNGAGFGRPAFGRPAFGNGAGGASSGGGFGKPAFGSGIVELTEDEQKLRDALKAQGEEEARKQAQTQAEEQRRQFSIHRGAGPQSSRAGRPEPERYAQHVAYQERLAAREKISEMDARRAAAAGGQRFTIQRTAPMSPEWQANTENKAGAWGQLKRRARQDEEAQDTPERAQARELQRGRGYTSPNARSTLQRQQYQEDLTIRSEGVGFKPAATWDRYQPPASQPETPRPASIWRAERPAMQAPEVNPAVQRLREEEAERARELEERRRQREERESQSLPEKAAVVASRNDTPGFKGRNKDKKKASRRDEFIAEEEEDDNEYALAAQKAQLKKDRKAAKAAKKAAAPTPVLLPEYISVTNLASALRVRLDDFVEKMEELGFEETSPDFILNGETAGLIAQEYNFEPLIDRSESEDLKARPPAEDTSIFPPRPPVVTIMGHVDHGKTTILDFLRKSSVAAGEAGGITQHIGAFSVPMPSGKVITFLDTPGHAAFLNMRQRGANVTDIVVLVVAADDSVKPQTIEAINHAKGARVPIIVAINKVDKEEANIDRVKQDLARHNVEIEDYGGDTQVVCVSGKTGQGMAELEEAVLTLSDVLDMRADTAGAAEGWVLEASIKSMGKVATVLVRRGTMRPGDFIVAGQTWARIRCMRNEAGFEIAEATPGTPVEIDGWKEQPEAGDEVLQAPTEQKAKSVVDYRLEAAERERLAQDMEAINEERKAVHEKRLREKQDAALAKARARDAEDGAEEGEDAEAEEAEEEAHGPKKVYFIVKGDVSGSVEAVLDSIAAIGNAEIAPHVLRSGVGAVSEFDIEHAAVARGFVISFNNAIDAAMKRKAEVAGVGLLESNIIYRLVDDVKATLSEFLPPLVSQKVLGEAEVAQVFAITVKGRKQKPVAGCKVRNGVVGRNAKVRVLRNGKKVFDGTLESLKNVKKDVMEVKKGGECGMGFDGWDGFEVGDQIQAYETKEEKRFL